MGFGNLPQHLLQLLKLLFTLLAILLGFLLGLIGLQLRGSRGIEGRLRLRRGVGLGLFRFIALLGGRLGVRGGLRGLLSQGLRLLLRAFHAAVKLFALAAELGHLPV